MAKCLKCGNPLPPVGECPRCALAPVAPPAPRLLSKELALDRRQRDLEPDEVPSEVTPPPEPTRPMRLSQRGATAPAFEEGDEDNESSFADAPGITPVRTTPPPVPPRVAPPKIPQNPPGLSPRVARPVVPVPSGHGSQPTSPALPRPAPAPSQGPVFDPELVAARTQPPELASEPRTPVSDAPRELRAIPAPLWRRLISGGVDVGLVVGVLWMFGALALAVTGLKMSKTHLEGVDGLVLRMRSLEPLLFPGVLLAVILSTVYHATLNVLWQGRTVGRRLMGIQLVDASGLAPAPQKVAVRAVLSVLSFFVFLGGFWLVLFDRRGQSLHDKLTSTFVIRPT